MEVDRVIDDCLLLKIVQSAESKNPDCEAVEVGIDKIPLEIVNGVVAVICVVEA